MNIRKHKLNMRAGRYLIVWNRKQNMGMLISRMEMLVLIYQHKTFIRNRQNIWKCYYLLRFSFDLILQATLWRCRRLSLWKKWLLRISSGDKSGRCLRLTTFPTFCADFLEILGSSNSWIPRGASSPVQGMIYIFHVSRLHNVGCRCLKYQYEIILTCGKRSTLGRPVMS